MSLLGLVIVGLMTAARVGWAALATVATFLGITLVGLLATALVAAIPACFYGLAYQDRELVRHGRHGSVLLASCTEAGSRDDRRWTCQGTFTADDRTIVIENLTVELGSQPGEIAEGWVRDDRATELTTRPVPGWAETAALVVLLVVAGIGVVWTLVRAVAYARRAAAWAW